MEGRGRGRRGRGGQGKGGVLVKGRGHVRTDPDLCDGIGSRVHPRFHLGGNRDNELCTHGIHEICFIQYCRVSTIDSRGRGFVAITQERRSGYSFRRRLLCEGPQDETY